MDLILDEILTRTSALTVAKSRAICKELNEATHAWNFVEKLHRGTEMAGGFFVQIQNKWRLMDCTFGKKRDLAASKELSLAFVPRKIEQIEATTKQSLILCRCESPKRPWIQFVVCKPMTQQWMEIPRPRTRYFTEKFALTVMSSNPSKLRYKIVRFSKPKPACVPDGKMLYITHRCEIFDSARWAWRVLPDDIRVPFGEHVLFWQPVVSTAGFFYALTSDCRILAFNWATESYDFISLPTPLIGDDRRLTLLECEGKLGLGFIAEPEREMELWVWERAGDNGVKAWNMQKRVNIECLTGNGGWCYALAMPSIDVVVFLTRNGIEFVHFGRCDSSKTRIVKRLECIGGSTELFWMESDRVEVALRAYNWN